MTLCINLGLWGQRGCILWWGQNSLNCQVTFIVSLQNGVTLTFISELTDEPYNYTTSSHSTESHIGGTRPTFDGTTDNSNFRTSELLGNFLISFFPNLILYFLWVLYLKQKFRQALKASNFSP